LYRFLPTPGVEVTNLEFESDVIRLSWKLSAEQYVPNLRHTNEVIGAYFTAGSRIHLYRFLDRLQENAIYCDTDSVIFIQPSVEPWPIATGAKMGTCNLHRKPPNSLLNFRQVGQIIMHTG
jgi:hypothetical protein